MGQRERQENAKAYPSAALFGGALFRIQTPELALEGGEWLMSSPTPSLRQQVVDLVMLGYHRAEITEKVSRLSEATVASYIKETLSSLSPADRASVMEKRKYRPPPPSAPSRYENKAPIGALHRLIGVRLYNYRMGVAKQTKTQFAEAHSLFNRVKLSNMEQGFHDFTLLELLKLSEVMGQDLTTLLHRGEGGPREKLRKGVVEE